MNKPRIRFTDSEQHYSLSFFEFCKLCETDIVGLQWNLTKLRFEYFGIPAVVQHGAEVTV